MSICRSHPKLIEDVSDGKYVNMRGINTKTMEDYGVMTWDDRQEYVYPSGGIKVRKLSEKGFYAKSGFKGDETLRYETCLLLVAPRWLRSLRGS